MKIQELANTLNLNQETVRMYRKKGLLKPEKNPKNGYYEYTDSDLYSLFFIRKLRGLNLSIQSISQILTNQSIPEMLDNFDQEILTAEEQIKLLERKLDSLKRTRNHLTECNFGEKKITNMESADTKYDITDFTNPDDPRLNIWLSEPELSTISLCIKKELLNQELPEGPVPVNIGIGTYQKVIEENHLPLLEDMSICPKGTYLSTIVELDSLTTIPRDALIPLQDYAKLHNFRFISNTTAFLIRVDRSKDITKFLFRIRVQVEKIYSK